RQQQGQTDPEGAANHPVGPIMLESRDQWLQGAGITALSKALDGGKPRAPAAMRGRTQQREHSQFAGLRHRPARGDPHRFFIAIEPGREVRNPISSALLQSLSYVLDAARTPSELVLRMRGCCDQFGHRAFKLLAEKARSKNKQQ